MSDRDAWTDHLTKQQQAASFKANKYGAKKKLVDGVLFDSTREARRYCELKLMEKAGQIARLKLQQKFELCAPKTNLRGDVADLQRMWTVGHYVADFTYDELSPDATRFVVEDAKGFRTSLYRWKKKHFEAQYGITIREV